MEDGGFAWIRPLHVGGMDLVATPSLLFGVMRDNLHLHNSNPRCPLEVVGGAASGGFPLPRKFREK